MIPRWQMEIRSIKTLKPNPDNPRVLTEKGMADLKKSVEKFGLAEPLVIQPDGTVIGGHARLKDAELRQETEIACMVPDRALTEAEMKELGIRLNRNVAGQWDWDILANQFEIEELTDWGFSEIELTGISGDTEDNNDTIGIPNKDPNIIVRLSLHPAIWLAKREEIIFILDKLNKAYECDYKIDE